MKKDASSRCKENAHVLLAKRKGRKFQFSKASEAQQKNNVIIWERPHINNAKFV